MTKEGSEDDDGKSFVIPAQAGIRWRAVIRHVRVGEHPLSSLKFAFVICILYNTAMKTATDITPFATYILTNHKKSVLYIGVTNDLKRRMTEHKSQFDPCAFTAKYNVNRLVYFEKFQSVNDAIAREKQLKHWNREWKERLINTVNPNWDDLFVNV